MSLVEPIKDGVRKYIRHVAGALNSVSGGRISPNMVTYTGLFAHVPIAYLIATGQLAIAGLFLIFFGLFDTLDGELARLQKKSSAEGMFIDSATDRIKEIILYSGIVFYLLEITYTRVAIFILVGALGVSLLTTYLNAWGEVVLAHYSRSKAHVINKTFRSGLLGFEIRMLLLTIGLLFDKLVIVLSIILVFGSLTVLQRYSNIVKTLRNV